MRFSGRAAVVGLVQRSKEAIHRAKSFAAGSRAMLRRVAIGFTLLNLVCN